MFRVKQSCIDTLGEHVILDFKNSFGEWRSVRRVAFPFVLALLLLTPLRSQTKPAGSIGGQVRDQSGSPIVNMPVQLVRIAYSSTGQRMFQWAATVRTDDRGEYQMRGVIPGYYYIVGGSGPGSAGSDGILEFNYAVTYFPGVMDLDRAGAITVRAGAEQRAMNFVMPRQELRRVRGRVIDSRTGQPPVSASIGMSYPTLTGGSGSFAGSRTYDAATGAFEFRNVVPGTYVIQATLQGSTIATDDRGRVTSNAALPVASETIHISSADIENVLLRLGSPASITGRMSIETSGGATSASLEGVRVQLSPSLVGIPVSGIFNAPQSQTTNPDGWFKVDGLIPGDYLVSLSGGLPPDFYFKSAWFGQWDVLNKPMQFSGSSGSILDIVIGTNGSRVEGRVIDDMLKPVSGVLAVLIPNSQRDRFDLYRTAITGPNGSFSFRGVSAGDYKVFSWEALDAYAFYNPAVLQLFEDKGRLVRLSESSYENVDVRLIPVESPQ